MKTKVCMCCHTVKETKNFFVKRSKKGLMDFCKTCYKDQPLEYREKMRIKFIFDALKNLK